MGYILENDFAATFKFDFPIVNDLIEILMLQYVLVKYYDMNSQTKYTLSIHIFLK